MTAAPPRSAPSMLDVAPVPTGIPRPAVAALIRRVRAASRMASNYHRNRALSAIVRDFINEYGAEGTTL